MRQDAQEEGARILAELRERGEAERQRLVAAAHDQIEADRAQAIQALRTEMGALAVELASRVVGEVAGLQTRASAASSTASWKSWMPSRRLRRQPHERSAPRSSAGPAQARRPR